MEILCNRDNVIVSELYCVKGGNDLEKHPYVNDLKSLSEAIKIAKSYLSFEITKTIQVEVCGLISKALYSRFKYALNGDIKEEILFETHSIEKMKDGIVERYKWENRRLSSSDVERCEKELKRLSDIFPSVVTFVRCSRMYGLKVHYDYLEEKQLQMMTNLLLNMTHISCDKAMQKYIYKDVEEMAKEIIRNTPSKDILN